MDTGEIQWIDLCLKQVVFFKKQIIENIWKNIAAKNHAFSFCIQTTQNHTT